MEEQKLLFFWYGPVAPCEWMYGSRPQLAKFAFVVLRGFFDGYLYLWPVIYEYLEPKFSFKLILLYIPPLISASVYYSQIERERSQESHYYL